MSNKEKINKFLRGNPRAGRRTIAKETGIPVDSVRDVLSNLDRPAPLAKDVDDYVLGALRKHALTLPELAEGLSVSVSDIRASIARLSAAHYLIEQRGTVLTLAKPGFARLPLQVLDGGGWTRVGLVSDTHLCCKEERLDALHAQYDLFKSEGITTVLHAGNMIDGFIPGLNQESVFSPSVHGQTQYVIDHYPQRKGITTHFITGDDHESWFMKNGLNWGSYMQSAAEKAGRYDLHYLAHVEADVEFTTPNGKSAILKVQHPGGGSAYARSYKGQKQVEAFQGGEKPAILMQGHYHVSNYMFDRNVHVIGMPGFQDQTIFARKKQLRMEIGGAILEFKQNPVDGAVTRLRVEWNMFYDRGYYKSFLKSDATLSKGHLTIKTK